MFSPAAGRPVDSCRRHGGAAAETESPSTPVNEGQKRSTSSPNPGRLSTGTPARWTSRPSVLARILPTKKSLYGDDGDHFDPLFVRDFPKSLRDAEGRDGQRNFFGFCGGIDRNTSLAWIIYGDQLFVWTLLSTSASSECVTLKIPFINKLRTGARESDVNDSWMVSIVRWDGNDRSSNQSSRLCSSAGLVMCNGKTETVVYWPDIYSVGEVSPPHSSNPQKSVFLDARKSTSWQHSYQSGERFRVNPNAFNSFIVSPVLGAKDECLALGCRSNGEIWRFYCTPSRIHQEKLYQVQHTEHRLAISGSWFMSHGYVRSLIWRFNQAKTSEEYSRQFFLLLDYDIQCWDIQLTHDGKISRLWSHRIVGTADDSLCKKDLTGEEQISLLDLQVDDHGKELTVLMASVYKDLASGLSSVQYSLLTMLHKPEMTHEAVLEMKDPIQVISPKVELENEDFLFSMRLKVGYLPSRTFIVLSGDGNATVIYYRRGFTHMYSLNLPYDTGRVLDASVLPSDEDSERAWIVLTEKAGIWAVPEKVILHHGVTPLDQNLSSRENGKEIHGGKILRGHELMTAFIPKVIDDGNKQRGVLTREIEGTAENEESEVMLSQIFSNFLLSGHVDGSCEKLKHCRAFEKDGDGNVFVRMSKSIVDTLPKHWTMARGPEIIAVAVLSSHLSDKQQKHEKYLQFLALSKCHEELCAKQRKSLQVIMDHGEKVAAMIVLRDLQDSQKQKLQDHHLLKDGRPLEGMAGSFWNMIQIIGEKARRNNILLMDRSNADVFYSKVSHLDEIFSCLSCELQFIVGQNQPLVIQVQKACELSMYLSALVRTAMEYRNVHHIWYPRNDDIVPWYCQSVVRSGLWDLACLFIRVSKETTEIDALIREELFSHLENLTDVFLETYSGAMFALSNDVEGHKWLAEEYCMRRDILLDCLYEQVHRLVEVRHQDLSQNDADVSELKETSLRALFETLLNIGRRHEAHQILWKICCDLNDSLLLRNLMQESVGPKGGFCYFVFNQLYEKQQFAKLLRLGEEFPEVLAVFLKHHKQLLWLHELFNHNFSSASDTLHALAFSESADSGKPTTERSDFFLMNGGPLCLADRKLLLNLSRIAAFAGGDASTMFKMRRIEADLHIIKLQVNDICRWRLWICVAVMGAKEGSSSCPMNLSKFVWKAGTDISHYEHLMFLHGLAPQNEEGARYYWKNAGKVLLTKTTGPIYTNYVLQASEMMRCSNFLERLYCLKLLRGAMDLMHRFLKRVLRMCYPCRKMERTILLLNVS